MRKFVLSSLLLLGALLSQAQILQPVKWKFEVEKVSDTEALLKATASIDKGWHLYSQFIKMTEDQFGPEVTVFTFNKNPSIQFLGKVEEKGKLTEEITPLFDNILVRFFSDKVTFVQKVKVLAENAVVTGNVYYMVCDDKQCLPPDEKEFEFKLAGFSAAAAVGIDAGDAEIAVIEETADSSTVAQSISATVVQDPAAEPGGATGDGLLAIFIAGFLGGLIALLTPCVFPMIPLTVSFFTKQSGSRRAGVMKALGYGLSIILIYVTLGLTVTVFFGSDALNALASDIWFNLAFFVLLVVFGASFLGAFEITLPASWVNKMDEKSDKGGVLGIFFMAFTLALVSFSCTGPIIGTLLVDAATRGALLGPAVGMTGFSLALALPFTLFAIFPGWLKSLPKSGGWLNSVKVVLGFLELAFALKFLSNVDLAYHWGILDREVFLVLWISIFLMLGLYLIGIIKFSHDSPLPYLSVPRLMFAIAAFSFTFYLVPGLWGAPLKSVNAFLPPMATQDFDLSRGGGHAVITDLNKEPRKYADLLHCPHNLDCFFDLEEGLAYAKKVGKPVMIDFTGHSCVNCRKMEATVWADGEVLRRLRDDYVLISLYVDDKTPLPLEEQFVSKFSGKKIKTVGNLWSDYQASTFNINSQPYYVLMDHDRTLLVPPTAYDPSIPAYINFLDSGKEVFYQKAGR
ncbi:MAG: cytochrome c biogenesis protein CcdA [Sphingobacteriaceae bacterium]|nr:cytochrome c biogenesis protein CcdA [Sphingobacteriaceae bacterium]